MKTSFQVDLVASFESSRVSQEDKDTSFEKKGLLIDALGVFFFTELEYSSFENFSLIIENLKLMPMDC